MADGTVEALKVLLLESSTGSLSRIMDLWPDKDVVTQALNDDHGLSDQITRQKIQIVIVDINAAKSPGLCSVEHIRGVHPDLPIFGVFAEAEFALAINAIRAGVTDILPQPYDKQDLDQALRRQKKKIQATQLRESVQQSAMRSLDDLVLLKVVGETMRSAANLQNLLDQIVELIQGAMNVDIVSLMMVDNGILKIRSSHGLPEDIREQVEIAPGEGVSGYVMETGEPVLIADLSADGRFSPRSDVGRYRTGSLLSVPIQYQKQTMGVLNINNKRSGGAFTSVDQELLQMIAHQTALAIENMKLVTRLREKTLEIEHAHEDLVKIHNDRTRFVCNLSHELKTPLTSVLGFADLLHNFYDQVDESRFREYVSRIYLEGKHLEKLLTGMLRLFSIDSGSEEWAWQALSVEDVLGRVLLEYDDNISTGPHDLQVNLPDDLKSVRGDEEKLYVLFDALVDNAIKFNRPHGRVMINGGNLTLHGESMVYLQFANDGQTVPQGDSESIFQGYSQLGDLNVGKPRGVGTGLATCRAILRQMNGEMFLEPFEDDAEGAAFALLLPTGQMEFNNG